MREGIEKGELKASREMIVEVLEEKFGVIAVGLNEIESVMMLKRLLRQAIRCKSLEEFEEMLEKVM